MRFSRFFIDRPIFAAVLSIVVFLAGARPGADQEPGECRQREA